MRAKSDYCLQCKLSGETGAILALEARDDGKYLASGGLNANGPKVWDLKDMRQVEVVTVASDLRGATTKLQWIKREDDICEALIYGTQNGFLVCCRLDNPGNAEPRFQEIWNRQMNAPCEVTGLAFDSATNRLAASHRGGTLQVFTLNSAMAENEVFSVVIRHCVPAALAFGAMSGNERELLVFGLYCGLVYTVRGMNVCSSDAAWNLGCCISNVDIDQTNGILCVSDPSSGVHLYRLTGRELVKSFLIPVNKTQQIRQVALLDSNRAVVSGSDHGVVYVYNHRDNLLTKLQVDPNAYQGLQTADVAGVPTIFTAKSAEVSGKSDIFVYRKTLITPNFMARLGSSLKWLGWLMIIMAAVAFGYEKITFAVGRVYSSDVCHRQMPASSHYTCERCPLANFCNHRVPKLQRISHQLEISKSQNPSGTQTGRVVTLGIKTAGPIAPIHEDDVLIHVSDEEALSAEATADASTLEMERLASLLTGLVILDEGKESHREMQSKLFSSRDDFQSSISEVPIEFMPISLKQVLGSVEAVLQAPTLPLRPATMKSQEENITLLQEMLKRIRAAHAELDLQRAFNASPATVDVLVNTVHSAGLLVIEAGRLLSSLKPSDKTRPPKRLRVRTRADEKIATLSESLQAEATTLNSLIDIIGPLLPPPTHVVEHNSDHHFENPIAKYDVITQLSILLALICHVIIGISSNPVNLILAFVNAIIQALMALCARDGRAKPVQEYVLKQLPTSLDSALRRFKIDPTTTIYATCPSCHYTHAPLEDRVNGVASYPEICQGYVYPRQGARHACRTQILERHQGKLRPIRPYVFTSVIDYIAATLSDTGIERMCKKACDDALAAVRAALSKNPEASVTEERVNAVFEAVFMRSFEGPVPSKLFIEREGCLRLAF
ncbi:unnamed protein product [Mycena citricolor]|uniref:Uncharacterized protein n=1 Tax=Mycena citricolor TaxID=2018698 RepID=A0AAD2K122_9AGAR|nr:unnamed protein product [Mycena citricolor]